LANILIIGSQGFIGTQLVKHFSAAGYAVTGCDIVEAPDDQYHYHKLSVFSPDFETLFAETTFDCCINAAGSGNVGYSVIHPQSDFEVNTAAVARVLDTIRKQQPACRFLHISSAAVYGNPSVLPVHEEAVPAPLSPYGYHKLMSETICREYAAIYGLSIAVMRPFSVFGNGLRKQLLWDICQKLQQSDTIQLFGTGNECRDFIHISDFVTATACIVEKSPFELNVYNVASGHSVSIKQVAVVFENTIAGKKILFSGETKQGDPDKWQADITALKSIGFNTTTDFEHCVKGYILWHREQSGKKKG